MGDSEGFQRFANPLLLNLQKMELELTCPICLKLLRMPKLLPCDHLCCSTCVNTLSRNGCSCAVCEVSFCEQDLRPALHIKAMTSIYNSMNSTVTSFVKQGLQIHNADTSIPSDRFRASGNKDSENKFEYEPKHEILGEKSKFTDFCRAGFRGVGTERTDYDDNNEVRLDVSKKVKQNSVAEASLEQKEPCTPESFSDRKDSDNDSNDAGSEPRNRSPAKCLIKNDRSFGTSQMEDDHVRSSKRKKVDNVSADCLQNYITVDCAFCHTSKTTEASGPILRYLHGNQMTDDEASLPGVLHVHKKCIEWAPQVFFAGEIAMNLEAELVRASKIKCTKCGLKGAALGCLVKCCRRSYHVPCAAEIPGCRWDDDNFVLLCPVHSSNKLPCDRSKRKTLADRPLCHTNLKEDRTSAAKQMQELWTASPSMTREWLLCGSALSNEDKIVLDKFVNLTEVATTSAWKASVTHVIAATDERGACTRTLKLLMAILGGKWVLSVNWLKACMEAGHPVPEEPYEINHDIHGSFDGPRTGRFRAIKKEPKLFAGLTFYFCGHFMPIYKGHIESLVLSAGGVVSEESEIIPTTFIVYNADPPQGNAVNDINEVIEKRKGEAASIASRTSSRIIPHTWLLDAIAACCLPPNL